jgi:integrase
VFLWETGCRPQEAAGLTVEQVDWDQRVARLADHKTAAHGGDRIIYLSRKAYAVAEQQRQRYRTGLLFRSKVGTRFRSQAFVRKFRRLSRRVGKRVCAYSFRHSFATRALADGESDTIVAELMGHHSTQMIHRHYKSASAMGRQLRDAADRIGKRAS